MRRILGLALIATVLGGVWLWLSQPKRLDRAALMARYAEPLPPQRPAGVFHLGHSLVGRDMPVMLAQLMGNRFHSQLGWGASLNQHWQGDVPGFAEENHAPFHRDAKQALASGEYDAVVLTEMVELKDAIKWHDSPRALGDWAAAARQVRGDVRVYLYETWHRLDDPAGWTARIAADLPALWEGTLLAQAMARPDGGTIHVIPAGQVMAALTAKIEAGEVPGLSRREDLFARNPDGSQDMIHLNDLGAYVVALTHFAVLAGQSPVGLPHALLRADGTPATAPDPKAAQIMQEVVWQVVTGYAATGVSG
ncbi:hypothetical protein [Gemmobacter denitrificans]|uniref:SGNH/GDSL hydrolase family protein n=1 Tax=Gemmobacter denitrificans TaxID=3123040 RepID=A0ABU8BST8_9RHOB